MNLTAIFATFSIGFPPHATAKRSRLCSPTTSSQRPTERGDGSAYRGSAMSPLSNVTRAGISQSSRCATRHSIMLEDHILSVGENASATTAQTASSTSIPSLKSNQLDVKDSNRLPANYVDTFRGGLVHHSDRGSQYLAIRYSERLLADGYFLASSLMASPRTARSILHLGNDHAGSIVMPFLVIFPICVLFFKFLDNCLPNSTAFN